MTNLEKAIEKIKNDPCFKKLSAIRIDDEDTCIEYSRDDPYGRTDWQEAFEYFGFCNIDNWDQEYKEPIRLTKFEKDLLEACLSVCGDFPFDRLGALPEMRDKGYFKDVTDTTLLIREILENCEVVDSD